MERDTMARPVQMPKSGLCTFDQTTDHAFVVTMVILGSRLYPSGDVALVVKRDTT